jgi:small subunit ribosomal protein S18
MVLKKKNTEEKDRKRKIDYKDIENLRCFVTERGKLLPNRITGISSQFQKEVKVAVKRARYIALLPFVADE